MKAKFATWFCLIFGLGCLREAFTKSLHSINDKGSVAFDLKTVNGIRLRTSSTNVSRITTELHYWTTNTQSQISDKKETGQVMEAQKGKERTTKVTLMRNFKEGNKFQSKLSTIGDCVFGSLVLVLCK